MQACNGPGACGRPSPSTCNGPGATGQVRAGVRVQAHATGQVQRARCMRASESRSPCHLLADVLEGDAAAPFASSQRLGTTLTRAKARIHASAEAGLRCRSTRETVRRSARCPPATEAAAAQPRCFYARTAEHALWRGAPAPSNAGEGMQQGQIPRRALRSASARGSGGPAPASLASGLEAGRQCREWLKPQGQDPHRLPALQRPLPSRECREALRGGSRRGCPLLLEIPAVEARTTRTSYTPRCLRDSPRAPLPPTVGDGRERMEGWREAGEEGQRTEGWKEGRTDRRTEGATDGGKEGGEEREDSWKEGQRERGMERGGEGEEGRRESQGERKEGRGEGGKENRTEGNVQWMGEGGRDRRRGRGGGRREGGMEGERGGGRGRA
jgi:hypothetical protein